MQLLVTKDVDITVEYFPITSARRPPEAQRSYRTVEGSQSPMPSSISRTARLIMRSLSDGTGSSGVYFVPDGHGLSSLVQVIDDANVDRSCLRIIKRNGEYGGAAVSLMRYRDLPHAISEANQGSTLEIAVALPCMAYGDSLGAAAALHSLKIFAKERGLSLSMTGYSNMCSETADILAASKSICAMKYFPLSEEELRAYDVFVDLTPMTVARDRPIVDSVLASLGIDPGSLQRELKHLPALHRTVSREISEFLQTARERSAPLVFFSPKASNAMRSMPDDLIREAVLLLKQQGWEVVSAFPGAESFDIRNFGLAAPNFMAYCDLVGGCDVVVTVDSAAMYIADSEGVPCLTFFTNNVGTVWAEPLQQVTPIQVGEPGPLASVHASSDAEHLLYVKTQWESIDLRTHLERFLRGVRVSN